jgi:hypothetical protein
MPPHVRMSIIHDIRELFLKYTLSLITLYLHAMNNTRETFHAMPSDVTMSIAHDMGELFRF